MKLSRIIAVVALVGAGFIAQAQNNPKKMEATEEKQKVAEQEKATDMAPAMEQEQPKGPKKIAIEPAELPKEVHEEVLRNYYNGEITEAFKIMREGKVKGYIAEVKNGPKKWTLEFDETGNALNKITPK
jgi:predicted  nucleic acid-binding Zn-ribbon protein